jgi:cytochrome c peroxidase
MRRHYLGLVLAFMLLPSGSAIGQEPLEGAATTPPCPPTPGIAANQDVLRGRCLFNSATVFQQDPGNPFASCSRCHYGSDKTDHSVHLVRVTNKAGQTIEVLRKTPSLLKAAQNGPFGADGRFASVQEAARAAILSPVEMRGASVTSDQLDALAAYILALPASDPDSSNFTQPAAPDTGTLNQIAIGHDVFFGKGTCVTCHAGPDFTNHAITTNQVNLTFSGGTDPGGGFVGTGPSRTFKVQSLLFFSNDRPAMHSAALGTVEQVARFYNQSLNLGLTSQQVTGLTYWLRNCLDPRRNPMPSTC